MFLCVGDCCRTAVLSGPGRGLGCGCGGGRVGRDLIVGPVVAGRSEVDDDGGDREE